ncbi:MAG: endonuclease III domain-containing protein [Gammaproteobacteria bacterium]|nr:MAG: endonuclease III domain-containing protein [Gammaproteobacteria bacterium]
MSFKATYNRLFNAYGNQHWWPGESPFEIMVGAVLTQNTAWSNVEKAIDNLKVKDSLDPQKIIAAHHRTLASCLKPSGYFNVKARRLKNFCHWYIDNGEYASLHTRDTGVLRDALLGVNGVGPETADDILLYAFVRPVFVIDAYTRRLFSRLGMVDKDSGYEVLRNTFEARLGKNDVQLFNEYHALIVHHAKYYCKVKPVCDECCLKRQCPSAI